MPTVCPARPSECSSPSECRACGVRARDTREGGASSGSTDPQADPQCRTVPNTGYVEHERTEEVPMPRPHPAHRHRRLPGCAGRRELGVPLRPVTDPRGRVLTVGDSDWHCRRTGRRATGRGDVRRRDVSRCRRDPRWSRQPSSPGDLGVAPSPPAALGADELDRVGVARRRRAAARANCGDALARRAAARALRRHRLRGAPRRRSPVRHVHRAGQHVRRRVRGRRQHRRSVLSTASARTAARPRRRAGRAVRRPDQVPPPAAPPHRSGRVNEVVEVELEERPPKR